MTENNEYQTRLEARYRAYEGFQENHTAAEWARLLGLPRNTLWRYLKGGLSIEDVARLRRIEYPPSK